MTTDDNVTTQPALNLDQCAREPIHVPGSIQPHGLLVAVRKEDASIVQVGANTARFGGPDAGELLGQNLGALLRPDDVEAVRATLVTARADPTPVYAGTVRPLASQKPVNLLLHWSDGLMIIELEPAGTEEALSFHNLYQLVRGAVPRLDGAATLEQLCAHAAGEVRRLTGFDRVMVYRFHPDWHGEVVAEARATDLPPLLGLHFPESDVPEQARRLYTLDRLRIIPDVGYEPVPLLPRDNPLTGRPTDLSHSVLRSVSPVHVEYLKNMGVGASMSVSVLRDGRLWGLIACHHRTPRFIPFDVRTACDLVAQVLSLQLAAREGRRDVERRIGLKSGLTRLLQHMAAETDFVEGLTRHGQELIDYVGAGGAAVYFGGRCALVGKTPSAEQVEALVNWLTRGPSAQTVEQEMFHSDALPEAYPEAAEFLDVAAGLLAVSVSRVHRSYVLWFRPEAVRSVDWSGDPHHPATVGGDRRLHPRHSFDLWKEAVRGRSLPWEAPELDAAADLRQAVVGIVLKKAEEVAQLAGALERSNKELEAFSYSISHDLRAPFRHIAGFAELLQKRARSQAQSGGVAMDDTSNRYVNTIAESARYAGALVDSLLSFTQIGRAPMRLVTVDMAVLARQVRAELEAEAQGRTVEWLIGDLPPAVGDPTMLHTALRNLMGNAVKYTRGRDPARITISAAEEGPGQVTYTVRDNGVGFDMRYAEKLFGVFQRLHRPEEFQGTGIGLANVKRIVERHGGRVSAAAEVGAGAAFSFTLPRAPAAAVPTPEESQ